MLKPRRKTRSVTVGSLALGSEHPVRVQTMTKGDTADLHKTFDEIIVSTVPTRLGQWLRRDLVRRASRRFDVPVTAVMASEADLKATVARAGRARGRIEAYRVGSLLAHRSLAGWSDSPLCEIARSIMRADRAL